jgi:hypothetical protein
MNFKSQHAKNENEFVSLLGKESMIQQVTNGVHFE